MIHNNMGQRTPEWREIRRGRITGSVLSEIIDRRASAWRPKKNWLRPLARVVAEIETGIPSDDCYVSDAMRHGIETEAEAIEAITPRLTGHIRPVGFVTRDDLPYFGVSPDVVCFKPDSDTPTSGCEIKCPLSKTHVMYALTPGIPSDYVCQVVAYFVAMPTLDTMTFASYDPLNLVRPIVARVVNRDDMDAHIMEATDIIRQFGRAVSEAVRS